jgi:hypothetical protein
MQCVENCDDPQHQVLYEQPVWQTLQMFLGEMLCECTTLFHTYFTLLSGHDRRSTRFSLP